ncbi:tyrosine-type recombinase/integrase [Oleiharenicola lentus]|uniref:tyrosine-type recombinase/integrase n=1 Tax=Oleiharenicola lentus TaxID=2508720 RepID=UPI003F66B033
MLLYVCTHKLVIEFVYRSARRVKGKRVKSRFYLGRYSLRSGEKPVTVALSTTDRQVALKRLRDIVVTAQKEAEGMIPSTALRDAAKSPLFVLLADYRNDLVSRGLKPNHVKESVRRIEMAMEFCGWKKLAEISPSSFIRFRADLSGGAKTKKEYQTSVNAFLNWCVRTDRLVSNPLLKVDRIDIRGKAVRPTRSFTAHELQLLFQNSAHALFYQSLLYTGQRRAEVASWQWGDLDLNDVSPFVLIGEGETKDKEKRAVPLKHQLAFLLRTVRPAGALNTDSVFLTPPSYEVLRADFIRAGVDHRDARGRVVHFHAFRKTFQTMGVRAGVNQRSAQALLGHSDPALTANAYTDVPALELHSEVAKLPWISDSLTNSHEKVSPLVSSQRFRVLCEELVSLASAAFPVVSGEKSGEESGCPTWIRTMTR